VVRCYLLYVGFGLLGLGSPVFAVTELAVTFDDLPAHGASAPGMSRLDVAEQIIRTLKHHAVPEVYGFLNGRSLRDEPALRDVVRAWVAAGFRLGNHTYSHVNLKEVTAAQYIADIARNEALLTEFSLDAARKVFRYPYLESGETREKRQAVREWLAARGYRIAPVTVDFGDWAWNDPYARCLGKRDEAGVARLRQTFLAAALDRLHASDALARRIFDRPIKHILMLHVGAFDAVMLDELLRAYEAAGVRTVSLDSALRDPAYAVDPGLVPSGELLFLEQSARVRSIQPPTAAPIPFTMLESVCR
jgi:peptidoglycan/xylan/chitin deacetylase (PgdA/CDA1 family)